MLHACLDRTGHFWQLCKQWCCDRRQEMVHCFACGGSVGPWTTHCPACGQVDPSRLPKSLGIYLPLGFGLLAVIVSLLIVAF